MIDPASSASAQTSWISAADVVKGLAASVLPLLSTVITLVAASARERSIPSKRARTIDEATKRTAFWDSWLKASLTTNAGEDLPHFRAKVYEELKAIAATVTLAFEVRIEDPAAAALAANAVAFESDHSSLSRFRRWFLLYKPYRGSGWAGKVFFYFYLLGAAVIAVASVVRGQIHAAEGIAGVAAILMALVFRYVAISLE